MSTQTIDNQTVEAAAPAAPASEAADAAKRTGQPQTSESAAADTPTHGKPHAAHPHAGHTQIVTPEQFVTAEQHLAQLAGKALSPELTKGLRIKLGNMYNGDTHPGHSTLELRFSGPLIAANFALMSDQLTRALKHYGPTKDLMTGTTHTVDRLDDHEGTHLSVTIPGLTHERYAQLIHALQQPVVDHAHAHPTHHEAHKPEADKPTADESPAAQVSVPAAHQGQLQAASQALAVG